MPIVRRALKMEKLTVTLYQRVFGSRVEVKEGEIWGCVVVEDRGWRRKKGRREEEEEVSLL